MSSLKRLAWRSAVLLAVMATSFSAFAAPVGRVFYVTGGVVVERGQNRIPVVKDTALESGDLVVTAEDGRVQWRLADDSFFVLRPSSRFKIEDFQYPEGKASSTVQKAFFEQIKGGFRTLTGLIGKQDQSSYRVKTPVATMGVRGTDPTLIYCQGDCAWAEKKTGNKISDGLYVRVDRGIVEFTNQGGSLTVKAGQYAYVASSTTAPVLLPQSPPVFITWKEDFEFRFPQGFFDPVNRSERIEPLLEQPCEDVPSPSTPCP